MSENFVNAWNEIRPVGTPVTITKDTGEVIKTTTRSKAWVLGNTPVVLVEGITGGHAFFVDGVQRIKYQGDS